VAEAQGKFKNPEEEERVPQKPSPENWCRHNTPRRLRACCGELQSVRYSDSTNFNCDLEMPSKCGYKSKPHVYIHATRM
jgi:hypothetical protein